MIKQLYTRNIGVFAKSATVTILSLFLVACGESDNASEPAENADAYGKRSKRS